MKEQSDIHRLLSFVVICGATIQQKSEKHFVISGMPKSEISLAQTFIERYAKEYLIEISEQ
jgi:hypothetical protein